MKKLLENKTVSFIISIILTVVSSAIIALGVKIFLSPNSFLSTGVTGIALIAGRLYDKIFLPAKSLETIIAGVLLFILNIPVLFLAWKKLSHKFMILSTINVITNTLCMTLLADNLHEIFNLSVASGDISFLDAALFVGMMNGAANALAYIVGGSTGGSDVLSMYFSLKKQSSLGKVTTIINGVIIIFGLFIEQGNDAIAKAFYTMIYLVINSIVIDLFYIRNKRTILLITTSKGQEVSKIINHRFVRGVTMMDAKGGYTGEHKDLLYCACSSFEVSEITKQVKELDEHAFISVLEANKVHGNFLNKELR